MICWLVASNLFWKTNWSVRDASSGVLVGRQFKVYANKYLWFGYFIIIYSLTFVRTYIYIFYIFMSNKNLN